MPPIQEPDDNTLDNAGPVGKEMASALSTKIIDAVDGFPASDRKQKAAIARIIANDLYNYAEEVER